MRPKPVRRPRVGLALRRRPRLRTGVVVTVALLCGTAVAATVQGAEDARAAWGPGTRVLVATDDLAAGDRLEPGNTRVEARPAPLVPTGALRTLPADARVATPVYAGEVVPEERLAPAGASAIAARLPVGARAMALPIEPGTTPPLAVGDVVEVLVALPPEGTGGGPPGFALTAAAPVLDVSQTAVTIAVDQAVAPRLAVAFGQAAVTLAVVRP